MSQASQETYIKPENEIKRISDREKVYAIFRIKGVRFTIREASDRLNMTYTTVQKRIHDLIKVDLLKIVDTKEENGNKNTVYEYNSNPNIFGNKYKSKFELLEMAIAKCVDPEVREAINDEFVRLKNNQFNNSKKKKCSGCKNSKPLHEFGNGGSTKSGLQSKCKECNRDYQKDYRKL